MKKILIYSLLATVLFGNSGVGCSRSNQAMYQELTQKFTMVSFPEKRQAIVAKYRLR